MAENILTWHDIWHDMTSHSCLSAPGRICMIMIIIIIIIEWILMIFYNLLFVLLSLSLLYSHSRLQIYFRLIAPLFLYPTAIDNEWVTGDSGNCRVFCSHASMAGHDSLKPHWAFNVITPPPLSTILMLSPPQLLLLMPQHHHPHHCQATAITLLELLADHRCLRGGWPFEVARIETNQVDRILTFLFLCQ